MKKCDNKNTKPRFYGKKVQVYVIENSNGYIKIGITTNFTQRLRSLGGSNGGGARITNYWVSRPTYVYRAEEQLQNYFFCNRIYGEWFINVTFDEVKQKAIELFNSEKFWFQELQMQERLVEDGIIKE